jgi:uncharacterized membrane protein
MSTMERTQQKDPLAQFLGWFSGALGVPQIVAPDRMNRLIGVKDDAETRFTQRAVGVQELACFAGILSRPRPVGWLWARVAGDVTHLGLLGLAFKNKRQDEKRLSAATANVAGIFVTDLFEAVRMTRSQDQPTEEEHAMDVRAAVTIRGPLEEVYAAWSASDPLPMLAEWASEVIEATPNQVIVWRSIEGTDVRHSGSVRFETAPGDRGTEVHVALEYELPGGKLGETVAKVFGEDPGQKVKDDLRRFKQVLETGEVVRSDGSPEGQRTRRLFKQRPAQPVEERVATGGRAS